MSDAYYDPMERGDDMDSLKEFHELHGRIAELERELTQLREHHQWHSVIDRPLAEWVDMSLFAVRGISGGQVLLLGHIDTGNIVDLCGDTTGYKWTDVTHWKRVEGPE
jgi:hypothetical protein